MKQYRITLSGYQKVEGDVIVNVRDGEGETEAVDKAWTVVETGAIQWQINATEDIELENVEEITK